MRTREQALHPDDPLYEQIHQVAQVIHELEVAGWPYYQEDYDTEAEARAERHTSASLSGLRKVKALAWGTPLTDPILKSAGVVLPTERGAFGQYRRG